MAFDISKIDCQDVGFFLPLVFLKNFMHSGDPFLNMCRQAIIFHITKTVNYQESFNPPAILLNNLQGSAETVDLGPHSQMRWQDKLSG